MEGGPLWPYLPAAGIRPGVLPVSTTELPDVPGYTDLEPVGSGGFSNVYRAHQAQFDRTVALKVLDVEMLDVETQRRFENECQIAGRVSRHPNIVTVLDSGFTEDGQPYISS